MSRAACWVGRHLVPLAVALRFVLPLLGMVTASLRGPGLAPASTIEWVPPEATLANYGTVFELLPFGRYLLNSLVVVGLAVPLTIVTASMAGFALALLEQRVRPRNSSIATTKSTGTCLMTSAP